MLGQLDIGAFILERDIFSRHSIAGCLSWDRRTHVVGQASSQSEMADLLSRAGKPAQIDALLLDLSLTPDEAELTAFADYCKAQMPQTRLVCLAQTPDVKLALAAARAGAHGFLVREQVGLAVASALCIAVEKCFTVTHDVAAHITQWDEWLCAVYVLPARRHHEEIPQRVVQALDLCVIDGLPAEVAADEMGLSTNTVRSYVKEGYRILEAEDGGQHLWSLSPMELAFVRYTSLEDISEDKPETQDTDGFVA